MRFICILSCGGGIPHRPDDRVAGRAGDKDFARAATVLGTWSWVLGLASSAAMPRGGIVDRPVGRVGPARLVALRQFNRQSLPPTQIAALPVFEILSESHAKSSLITSTTSCLNSCLDTPAAEALFRQYWFAEALEAFALPLNRERSRNAVSTARSAPWTSSFHLRRPSLLVERSLTSP